jgi:hypothetical protein
MLVGIDGKAGEAVDFCRERLPKTGRSPGDRVLVKETAGALCKGLDQGRRRIKIGKALRQIDRE